MLTVLGISLLILLVIAIHDVTQKRHTILRNFPIIGHFRYMFEAIAPELRQYWFETKQRPYTEEQRAFVYASSKRENNKRGFGTKQDYSGPGAIHLLPSMFPIPDKEMGTKIAPIIIGPNRRHPYVCPWPINISGMSFGALSDVAVRALSHGARLADIHMSTGEGSITPYHLEGGCRLVVQIGPAKFGFRNEAGELDMDKLREVAALDNVVGFEIKLAQGAKPGAGGILPKEKITPEIAGIRGIPMDRDCHSPNTWSEFRDVPSMFKFLTMLQEATGKPVGIKMVAGSNDFIRKVAKQMRDTGEGPDFITVDGGEGGTGAAPVMLTDYAGLPIMEAIPLVDNALREFGVRDRTVVVSSGKVINAADAAIHMALGSDMVNIGRGFLFSLGCIQAMRCHTNQCPTGITTQNRWLKRGLDPTLKMHRVANYAMVLQEDLIMLLKMCGVRHPSEITRAHVSMIRDPGPGKRMSEIFPYPDGTESAHKALIGQLPEAANETPAPSQGSAPLIQIQVRRKQ
jgi:glutamate synthase domain-containing protein 2